MPRVGVYKLSLVFGFQNELPHEQERSNLASGRFDAYGGSDRTRYTRCSDAWVEPAGCSIRRPSLV